MWLSLIFQNPRIQQQNTTKEGVYETAAPVHTPPTYDTIARSNGKTKFHFVNENFQLPIISK